jgi:cytochrome c oxidase subunit 2
MPIAVRVVNERDYAAWLEQAKKKFASDDAAPAATLVAAKAAR